VDSLRTVIAALKAVAAEFPGIPDDPPLEFQVSDPEICAGG
jgi:hypothetical protein